MISGTKKRKLYTKPQFVLLLYPKEKFGGARLELISDVNKDGRGDNFERPVTVKHKKSKDLPKQVFLGGRSHCVVQV